jgi:hypothetical protein
VNVRGASVKNKAAVNRAAVNRGAGVNRAGDKTGSLERKKRWGVTPAAFFVATFSVYGYYVIFWRYQVQPFCGALLPACLKA